MINLSNHQIKRLKADAKKLAREKNIKLAVAQDLVAAALGFASLALLINYSNRDEHWPATHNGVNTALRAFLSALSETQVYSLTRYSGTIWIAQNDFISNKITADSFKVLGSIEYALQEARFYHRGFVLAFNLDGLSSNFYFGEEDEPFEVSEQENYSFTRAKEIILAGISHGSIFDDVSQEIDSIQSQRENSLEM